jgi:hypothetical protein
MDRVSDATYFRVVSFYLLYAGEQHAGMASFRILQGYLPGSQAYCSKVPGIVMVWLY